MNKELHDLREKLSAANTALSNLETVRARRLDQAKAEIMAQFKNAIDVVQTAVNEAQLVLGEYLHERAVSGIDAPHPVGTKLVKSKWSDHVEMEYGVLEMRTLTTVFPFNTGSWRLPALNEPFVRMFNANGKLGKTFRPYHDKWVVAK